MSKAPCPPPVAARQADGMVVVALGAALSAAVAAAWPTSVGAGVPMAACRCPHELPADDSCDRARLGCLPPCSSALPGAGPIRCPPVEATRASWLLLSGVGLELNLASAAELAELPGVGPKLAAAIVAHRRRLGGFVSTAQLAQVPGIGRHKQAQLQPLLRLGAPTG